LFCGFKVPVKGLGCEQMMTEMTRAGFADGDIIAEPRMPPSFQNRRIKSFSLGHEHTLALDRNGQ